MYCSDCGATLGRAEATIADLRDRLRTLAPVVCEGCGCAHAEDMCIDCWTAAQPQSGMMHGRERRAAACLSVGLRALCGRKLLEGC